MKRISRPLALIGMLGAIPAAHAACDVYVDSVPYTISAPGNYCLRHNVTLSQPGYAITIATTDVTVDLMGYGILNNQSATTYTVGIYSDWRRITVRNGLIRGFTIGVRLASIVETPNFLVEKLVVRQSGWKGIQVYGGPSTIQDNVVSETSTRVYAPSQYAVGIDLVGNTGAMG